VVRRGPLYTAVSMTIDPQRELLEGVAEVDQTEIPFRAGNSFFDSQSQVAEPFVWTRRSTSAASRGDVSATCDSGY